MATYVLVPGAGGDGWYWHRVVPLLAARGHEVLAVELPASDDRAGWSEYAEATMGTDRCLESYRAQKTAAKATFPRT